jgi:hypothetical protein
MIKPWAPRYYNSCSKQLPSIWRQKVVRSNAFSRTRLNMLASIVITAAWRLATRSLIVLEGTAKTCSFRCSHRIKQSIGVSFDDRGGHAIGSQRLGNVAFNHCLTSSPQCAGAPSCWNHNLCLTARARGTPSSSHGTTVWRKSWHRWSACEAADGPTTMSPTIPAPTLTLKWKWYLC